MNCPLKPRARAAALVTAVMLAIPGVAPAGDVRDELRDLRHWLQDRRPNQEEDRRRYDEETKRLPAQWWQWASSIPAGINPLDERTAEGGSRCAIGQRGAVWFLAGSGAPGVYSRQCTVPANVELFFPIYNFVAFDTPGHCGQKVGETLAVADMRQWAAAAVDGVRRYTATLDSVPLERRAVRRLRSEVFAVALPDDSLFAPGCATADPPTLPAGVYAPAVDDGIYVRLGKLSPGAHVLHFTVTSGEGKDPFDLDVTYRLDVVPVRLH